MLCKNVACFPDIEKDAAFPESKKIVCQTRTFTAADDCKIILVPSSHMQDDDVPEPFFVACDDLRCPVIKVSDGKYANLAEGWVSCRAKGRLVESEVGCMGSSFRLNSESPFHETDVDGFSGYPESSEEASSSASQLIADIGAMSLK